MTERHLQEALNIVELFKIIESKTNEKSENVYWVSESIKHLKGNLRQGSECCDMRELKNLKK